MRNNRMTLLLMAACGIVLATAGCSSSSEKPAPSPADGANPTSTVAPGAKGDTGGGGATKGMKAPFDPSK